MGWNDHINEYAFKREEECPFCHKIFMCEFTEQTPGFRWDEDMKCPYCGKVVKTSLEYEFFTYKIED